MTISFPKHVMLTYGFKCIRLPLMYLALYLTDINMENVYLDKVLGNNEEPPALMNFIWLFLVIDFILTIGVVLVIKLLEHFKAFGEGESFIRPYLMDYIMSMAVFVCFGSILTSYMENKKYFLYRDDGLRAIRALTEIMFYFGIIFVLIPYELAVDLMATGISCKGKAVAAVAPVAPIA